jgi:hypothetical protein
MARSDNLNPEDELTPATIFSIVWDVREKTADPADVKRILTYFCGLVEEGRSLPIEILDYLKDSFRLYLADTTKGMESALGLKRGKRGRPKASADKRTAIATEILRHLLGGCNSEEAISRVGNEFHKESSVLYQAWAAHKQDALFVLRVERALDKYPWTQEEVQRLSEIYSDEPWFIPPGKDNNKPK